MTHIDCMIDTNAGFLYARASSRDESDICKLCTIEVDSAWTIAGMEALSKAGIATFMVEKEFHGGGVTAEDMDSVDLS